MPGSRTTTYPAGSPRAPLAEATDAIGGTVMSNRILDLLATHAPAEHARLAHLLELVTLTQGDILFASGEPIEHVYFPVDCVASMIKSFRDGKRIEVGTAGLEGLVGLEAFLDADTAPLECTIQVGGFAWRLPTELLGALALVDTTLHRLMMRYARFRLVQATQAAACNRLHGVERRCARWLLMMHDRVAGDRLELKHSYLATMLGVRRASVSEAADALQRAGLIRYRRGKVTIVDRAGLESASCECYRSERAEYDRLLSPAALGRATPASVPVIAAPGPIGAATL